MERLGVWLSQAREAKGSSLEEAEASTRIRARFLEMLEAGDFAGLPGSEVQVRGFLRIYARHLGLSPDDVVARYDAEVHGIEPATPEVLSEETQPAPPDRSAGGPAAFQPRDIPVLTSRPRWLSVGTLLIVAVVLILLLTLATAAYLVTRDGGGRPVVGPTSTAAVLQPPPTTTAAATPTFPVNPEGEVTLTLEAGEHVWVRVTRDTETAFEGMMAPGQTVTWSSDDVIAVETGNGAGLLVTVNGQPQGAMCGRGEVCNRAWEATGEVTPSSP